MLIFIVTKPMTKKKAFKALKISSKPSKPSKDAPMTFADLIDDDDIFSDPHVRIVGRKDDVLRVKDKIMAVLDAKVSRQNFFSRNVFGIFFQEK